MKDLTEAVAKNLAVKPGAVTVQLVESPRDANAKGGIPFSER
jgi:predicted RNA-binding protein YlqC (UPF0109 family)